MIEWIVNRLHVSLTDREIIAEFRNRMRGKEFSRAYRHGIYRLALGFHHRNQNLYNDVVSGRIGHGS